MASSSSDEEFELNYLKLDTKNEIRILEDFDIEISAMMLSVNEFENENIGKILAQFIRRNIPESNEFIKINLEYSKQFVKIINAEKKKGLNSSINQILSIDFRDTFIFNKTNVQNIAMILAFCYNELKKFKINSLKELKNAISKINFQKYDFFKIYINNEHLKNKSKDKIDLTLSRGSSQCKSTTFSSYSTPFKDLYDENEELEENNLVNEYNKNHNIARGIFYIDNNLKNIMCSSILTEEYIYNEEEEFKKILTKECFYYPKSNIKNTANDYLPIELILLLSKFKNIKTLIFQIKKVDEQFTKMAIFILINLKWLFFNEIEEIQFDLGNEEMQKELNDLFNERSSELYYRFHKNKNLIYYNGSYQARTINCWEAEEDIFFAKYETKEEKNKKLDYLYSLQPSNDTSNFGNHICNIYNEFGNLTNLKYIRPISYTIKNQYNDYQLEQRVEDYDENWNNIDLNISVGDIQRMERESISLTNTASFNVGRITTGRNSIQSNNNQINNNYNNSSLKTTPQMISKFVNKYKLCLEMIIIYSYFFTKSIKTIKKLNLYFHTPFFYEICQYFNMKLNFDNSHFLIFAKEIETLKEANFSFNSLDDKSFQYLTGIIFRNNNLSSLRISFFTPDINYFDYSLFNICSSKKMSLTKLFQDQKDYEIKYSQNQEERMNYYILKEKLLVPFTTNLNNFFNLLKIKTMANLEELILRFDMPISLLEIEQYIILIIKFILNIFIMITFQLNKIHTLKLLAPHLELNCSIMPFISQLFREISLKDEMVAKMNDENEIKERRKIKQRALKELREKENELNQKKKELKEKNERNKLLEKIKSKEDIAKTYQDNNNNIKKVNKDNDDEDDEFDIDKKIEKYDYKRFNSVIKKKQKEKAAKRFESINIEDYSNKKRSELNTNLTLKNIVIQLKIYELPEIFNICLMNNLSGLKSINLGSMDEITFMGFMNSYKKNYCKLRNLNTLKITLGLSAKSYISLEKYIIEYININSPKLEEKFLFSELIIINENKMKELIELVYIASLVPKLVVQISNDNEHLLSKVLTQYINEKRNESRVEMISLIILTELPQFRNLYNPKILDCLSSFYGLDKNKAIICKENPNIHSF